RIVVSVCANDTAPGSRSAAVAASATASARVGIGCIPGSFCSRVHPLPARSNQCMKLLAPLALAAVLLAAAAPPANAQATSPFRIVADTVTTGENPGVQGVPCVNETVFFPG